MKEINTVFRELSVEEKAGMIFMLAFSGSRLDEAQRLISEYHIGGCYLSRDNAATPEAAARLSTELEGYVRGPGADLPLLLGVDQEGAWAAFVPESSTGPGNMALGAAGDPELTRRMYRVIASEMSAIGYNTLLAPCVDVNSNAENPIVGMRSFGGRAEEVARHAAAAVAGARDGGVLTTAKHFPGHGNTTTDSHRGLPRVDGDLRVINTVDLPPFKAAISAGVDIIMTSHILYPALDEEHPATLSPRILEGLLREELGFEGLVISDSMNMGSIRKNYRPEEAATAALRAGVDMIMLAEEHYDHDADRYLQNQIAMIEHVAEVARNDESTMSRLDAAVMRILLARERALHRQERRPAANSVGSAENRAVEREAAERAVWTVQNRRSTIPIPKGSSVAIVPLSPRSAYKILTQTRGIGPNQSEPAADAFVKEMRRSYPKAHVQQVESLLDGRGPDSTTLDSDVVIGVIEEYPLPGVSFDKSTVEPALALLEQLSDRLILVGLCDPYLAARYADIAGACLCAASSRACGAQAAARALSGAFTPGGGSPMGGD